jgi:hypothetical protein
MAETKTYAGGCHCGAVAFEADAAIDHGMSCNCSICRKKGHLLAFIPEAAFRLKAGEGAQTEYRFNTHKIAHLFCKTCGIESFARGERPDGAVMVALNLGCLEGLDLAAVPVREFDGAKL